MPTNFTRASLTPLTHIWLALGGDLGDDSEGDATWAPTHANICASLLQRVFVLKAHIEQHGNIFTPEVETYQITEPHVTELAEAGIEKGLDRLNFDTIKLLITVTGPPLSDSPSSRTILRSLLAHRLRKMVSMHLNDVAVFTDRKPTRRQQRL